MRRTMRSMAGARAVALLLVASLVAVTAALPATAQVSQPTVAVTPDVVAGGDPVTVEFSGFTEGPGGYGSYTLVLICAADAVGATTVPTDRCSPAGGQEGPGLPAGSFESHPYGVFADVNCATVAGGCVIGVVHVVDHDRIVAQAWDRIAFHPTFDGTDMHRLEDGQTVTVTGQVMPPGEWQLLQCGRAYLDDPTPARAAQLCGPPAPVSAGAEARFSADVVVHDPVVPPAPGAAPVRCSRSGCVLVVAGASVPLADSIALSFGLLRLAVTPSSGLADEATVEVAVEDWPVEDGRTVRVAQCLYPLRGVSTHAGCGPPATVVIDDSGRGRTTLPVRGMLSIVSPQIPPGSLGDCRVSECAVGLFATSPDATLTRSVALQFAAPPLTVTPDRDLLDGQPMAVATSGLAPGRYRLDVCQPPRVFPGTGYACGPEATVTVAADGVLDLQVPARQRFTSSAGTHQYCGQLPPCLLRLWSAARSAYVAQRGYGLARANLIVSPTTGLRDGQSVQVSGNQLMSSYAGPVPASGGGPSGQWRLVQCNRNVSLFPPAGWTGEQYMWGLLLNCSTYSPPAVPVPVPGSTFQTTFTVRSTIHNVALQPTDCTASPAACLIGLVRIEQDGSLSRHLTWLTFGP